ncbi:MAG TPA: hypothetical protein VMS94_02055 [Acidobacteriota bacterium]|nr:hypothetical protein [Acidobacteriota bacterium]
MKCCPKCGSVNITFPAFYRPSIWKCLDCDYEGAFIVENGKLPEKMQECCLERGNAIDWTGGDICVDNMAMLTDNSLKTDLGKRSS